MNVKHNQLPVISSSEACRTELALLGLPLTELVELVSDAILLCVGFRSLTVVGSSKEAIVSAVSFLPGLRLRRL